MSKISFRNISIVVSAVTGDASKSLELFAKQVEATGAKASGINKNFLALGTGMAIAGIASVKLASDFQRAMELIHTQAGASQAEVDGMRNSILALAPAVGQGPVKLADAMYHIESIGLRGAKALDVLKTAAMGATIGNADLEQTTNALASTIASNIGGFHGMKDAMAILNNTVGQGNMRMDDLAASMSTGVLPAAKTAGLGLIDVGAALATMTDTGVPAEEAATRLRMTFSLMAGPTDAAKKALAGIGLSATDLAKDMRQPNGLLVAVQDLRRHLGNLQSTAGGIAAEDTLVKAFGGGRSSGAIMTLVQEVDRLTTKYQSYGTVASRQATFQDAWAATTATFSFKMHQLGAELQVVAIRVGTVLLPVIEHAVSGLQTLAHWLSESVHFLNDHRAAVAAIGAAWLAIKWGSIASSASSAMATIYLKALYARDGMVAATIAAGGLSGALTKLGFVAGVGLIIYGLVKQLQNVHDASVAGKQSIVDMAAAVNTHSLPALQAFQGQLEKQRAALEALTHSLPKAADAANMPKWRAALKEADAQLATNAARITAYQAVLAGLGLRFGMTAGQVQNFADLNKIDLTVGLDSASAAFAKAIKAATGMSDATGNVVAAYQNLDATLVAWHKQLDPTVADLGKQYDLFDALPDKIRITGAALLKNVHDQTVAMLQEGQNVQKLVREGLDPGIIQALVAKGPEYVAAAASLSVANIKKFGREYNAGMTATLVTARTIAHAEAPKVYQAVIDAEATKRAAIAASQRRAFVEQLMPAIATAKQIAAAGAVTTMDGAGRKIVDSAPKMLQAYLGSLKDPLRTAVATALGVGKQGGTDLTLAVASAIVAGTPRTGTAAAKMTKAIQDEINSLKGQKVTLSVDEIIASATFSAERAALFNNPATGRPYINSRAEGGPISGGYPGRDSVHVLAMPGEHMLTVADVDALGGHSGVYALRKALHMAAGGAVITDTITHPPAGVVAGPARAEAARLIAQTIHLLGLGGFGAPIGGGGGATSTGQYVQLGQIMAGAYGWVGAMFTALNKLWTRESGWNPWAVNPSSGAYGIPQSLGHGHPYNLGDAQAQILWGLAYIAGRYGNPGNAWAHETRFGWYDRGGYLPPGLSVAYNGTGRPEPVGGGGTVVNVAPGAVTITISDAASPQQTAALVERKISKAFGDFARMVGAGTGRG